jgi:hypothetical protein
VFDSDYEVPVHEPATVFVNGLAFCEHGKGNGDCPIVEVQPGYFKDIAEVIQIVQKKLRTCFVLILHSTDGVRSSDELFEDREAVWEEALEFLHTLQHAAGEETNEESQVRVWMKPGASKKVVLKKVPTHTHTHCYVGLFRVF